MFETGQVVEKKGNQAFIKITRPGDCSRCGLCPDRTAKILEISDPAIAVGDRVEVEIPENELIKISLTLYLVPALVFVFGFLAGALFLEDKWGLLTGLALLLPASLLLRRHCRRKQPHILARKI